ncbi:MAG: arginyl-tRNA--protein arginylyltransferase [Arcicella sp.]|jgi:arginine-tRNA-protein transferase|nr:arginyl-tRNA--protein arginylyltransferase [Arcicella sp.]
MLAELHFPSHNILPEQLDSYLSSGWFRMGQTIFTTNFLKFNGLFYSTIWLRIDLDTFKPTKTQEKIRKLNTKFRVEIKPTTPDISPEYLILFNKYKNHVSFDTAPSLSHLLYDNGFSNVFDSWAVEVYDDKQLIACGILDMGKETSEGIVCFYDPDYKKYSLGKYLMLLKMEFCQRKDMKHFYPGYFAPNYPLFDYKLDLSDTSLEYLALATNTWTPIQCFQSTETPLAVMNRKLQELSKLLERSWFEHQLLHYEYFDAEIVPSFTGLNLFDFPVFIFCFEVDKSISNPIIVFDVISQQYHLIICNATYKLERITPKDNIYNSHLLQMTQHLFATDSPEAMALVVIKSLRQS